ncbi:MAG: ATP-binding protein, partial [Bacteroidales bacterium]|nr:ATP-binding protein [Bacteroidales bacterium]
MKKGNYLSRVLSLIIYIIVLFVVFSVTGHSILLNDSIDTLIFSTLMALAINLFLAECFFETPKDVIAASLNVLILLGSLYVNNNFPKHFFYALFWYSVLCLTFSVASVVFYKPEENLNTWYNKTSDFLKNLSVNIGKSRIIFSILLGSLLINFYKSDDTVFYSVIATYLILLLADPIRQLLLCCFDFLQSLFKIEILDAVGKMIAVKSKDSFIIDLLDKQKKLDIFDFIEFKYGADKTLVRALVIDKYYLEHQQKIKAIILSKTPSDSKEYKENMIYKAVPTDEEKEVSENFVGTVIDNSNISQIKFEYSSKKIINAGDLLEVQVKDKNDSNVHVLYQVTQAVTDIRNIEDKNEIGLIKTTATQLGVWKPETRNFEGYGWVPEVNSKIVMANNLIGAEIQQGKEIQLGTIEDTAFKVLANIENLITHHTAILGTTGSGKSVFSRKIIKDFADSGNKVFCIDLTGEIKRFLNTMELVDTKTNITISALNTNVGGLIKWIVNENTKFANQRSSDYEDVRVAVENHIKLGLQSFSNDSMQNIGIFELPELSNTEET